VDGGVTADSSDTNAGNSVVDEPLETKMPTRKNLHSTEKSHNSINPKHNLWDDCKKSKDVPKHGNSRVMVGDRFDEAEQGKSEIAVPMTWL
jgi:hypothetical protein